MARPTGPQRGKREKRHPKRRRGEPDKPKAKRLRGVVRMSGDGSARLMAEVKGSPNVYLPPEEIVGVRNGDIVTVELDVGRKGRVRGRVVERGQTQSSTVVGVLRQQQRFMYLLPDDGSSALVVPVNELHDAKDGDAVEAQILREGDTEGASVARVLQVLGDPADPRVQVDMAVRATKWPREFAPEVHDEVASFRPVDPQRVLVDGRHDLRGVPHVTIDGEDARDFDDAVSARIEGERYRVWVSIADVSHYVKGGTALDAAARERATSVYFPDRVLPMLPEGLSNELCSLKPNVPRLTMTCEMVVDKDGMMHDVQVYPSLIESEARLTYTIVQEVLDREHGDLAGPPHPQAELIKRLVVPARWLRAQRQRRGAIDFEIPESKIVIKDGIAVDIAQRQRLEAHRLIEDLMVAANEAVAEYVIANNLLALFRVHDAPDPVKLELLVAWAGKIGVPFDPEEAKEPKYLQRFLTRVRNHPAIGVLQSLVLRMMAQARYEPENKGHYGLASKAYAHFTSPIRRYPDLVVHRALRAFWTHAPKLTHLDALGEHCSQRERKAMEAERGVTQLMACQIAQQHIGEEMEATVQGVHPAGAFVRPKELFVDGLVPMEALSAHFRGYYEYIEEEQVLYARRTRHRIQLGDSMAVELASVNMKRRQIDFLPVDERAARRPPKEPKARKGRKHERDDRTARWTPADIPDRDGGRAPAYGGRSTGHDGGREPTQAGRDGAQARDDARAIARGEHKKEPFGWFESERIEAERKQRASTAPHQSEAPRTRPRSWEEQYLEPSQPTRPRRFEEMREARGSAVESDRGERKRSGRYGMMANPVDSSGRPRRNKIAPRPGKGGKSHDHGKRSGGHHAGGKGARPKR